MGEKLFSNYSLSDGISAISSDGRTFEFKYCSEKKFTKHLNNATKKADVAFLVVVEEGEAKDPVEKKLKKSELLKGREVIVIKVNTEMNIEGLYKKTATSEEEAGTTKHQGSRSYEDILEKRHPLIHSLLSSLPDVKSNDQASIDYSSYEKASKENNVLYDTSEGETAPIQDKDLTPEEEITGTRDQSRSRSRDANVQNIGLQLSPTQSLRMLNSGYYLTDQFVDLGIAPIEGLRSIFALLRGILQSVRSSLGAIYTSVAVAFDRLFSGKLGRGSNAVSSSRTSLVLNDIVLGESSLFEDEQEAQRQLDEVRRRYEGTDQWMKAPNGEPTKLTVRQWLLVRTPNFIRWFGNWIFGEKSVVELIDMSGIYLSSQGINIKEISALHD